MDFYPENIKEETEFRIEKIRLAHSERAPPTKDF
jgi:hypothetical protein